MSDINPLTVLDLLSMGEDERHELRRALASVAVLEAHLNESEPEPDYEALGYPETMLGSTGRHTLDVWVDRRLYVMMGAGVDWWVAWTRSMDNEKHDDTE